MRRRGLPPTALAVRRIHHRQNEHIKQNPRCATIAYCCRASTQCYSDMSNVCVQFGNLVRGYMCASHFLLGHFIQYSVVLAHHRRVFYARIDEAFIFDLNSCTTRNTLPIFSECAVDGQQGNCIAHLQPMCLVSDLCSGNLLPIVLRRAQAERVEFCRFRLDVCSPKILWMCLNVRHPTQQKDL